MHSSDEWCVLQTSTLTILETILLYQEKSSTIWLTFFIEAEHIHMSSHMTYWLKVKFYSSFIHNVYLCSAVDWH